MSEEQNRESMDNQELAQALSNLYVASKHISKIDLNRLMNRLQDLDDKGDLDPQAYILTQPHLAHVIRLTDLAKQVKEEIGRAPKRGQIGTKNNVVA